MMQRWQSAVMILCNYYTFSWFITTYQFVIVVMIITLNMSPCVIYATRTQYSINSDSLSTIRYQITIVLTDGSHRCNLHDCDVLKIRVENSSTTLCGFHFLRISDTTDDLGFWACARLSIDLSFFTELAALVQKLPFSF